MVQMVPEQKSKGVLFMAHHQKKTTTTKKGNHVGIRQTAEYKAQAGYWC